ncbi:hypothetical protein [Agrobacterium tumefaciens]|uniref:hypothetical protein n=1 Tax=Agrobacterium tumefaciens TaxID=358 RepID=UPI001572A8C4|nr:hypothetical protein [Agrobacterium tumefaciens]
MKLFWSWQSDNDQESGRHFVREVLAELAAEMNSEAEDADRPIMDDEDDTDDARIAVDHDTLDVGGSPPIADTILRKIREAGVFIADVTPVGTSKNGQKLLPNPNVMIELGYALRVLEHERIVLLMNRAEGAKSKHLPFDLRHWRKPVSYSLPPKATDEQRAKAANDLKTALRFPVEASLKAAARAKREEHRRTVREPLLSVALDPDQTGPWVISQYVVDLGVKTLAAIQAETPRLPLPKQAMASLLGPTRSFSSLSGFGHQKPVSEWGLDEIERYNRSVDHYYREYEAYLDAVAEFERLGLRTFDVRLEVVNSGTAPATGIDVDITFPPGLILYDGDHGPEAPKPPEAPPRVALGPGQAFARMIQPDFKSLLSPINRERTEFYYPEDRQVRLKISELKHHHVWSADPIRLSFATASDIGPFDFEYDITANEPPEPIKGNVRLEFSCDGVEAAHQSGGTS